MRSAHGGVFPKWEHGSRVTYRVLSRRRVLSRTDSMALTSAWAWPGAVMIPLSDDFAPGDDHTAYHGVGIGRPQSFTGQGEGHVHVFFILVHHLFSFHLVFRQSPKAAHGKNDNA